MKAMLLLLLNTAVAAPWSFGPSLSVLHHAIQAPTENFLQKNFTNNAGAWFLDVTPLGGSVSYALRENIELSASGTLHFRGVTRNSGEFYYWCVNDCSSLGFGDDVRRTGLLRLDAEFRDEGPGPWFAFGGAVATRNYELDSIGECCWSSYYPTHTPMVGPTASIGWRKQLSNEQWTLDTGLSVLWFPGRDPEVSIRHLGRAGGRNYYMKIKNDASSPWMLQVMLTPRWHGRS